MESALGWSEILALAVLAALLLDTQDLRKLFVLGKRLRTMLYKFRYDLEDALQGEGAPMPIDLRKQVQEAIRKMSTEQRTLESASIVAQLRAHPALQKATRIAAFHPCSTEPAITPWLSDLADQGRLLLPRVLPDRQMEFVLVHNLDQELRTGAFGLREPRPDLPASTEVPTAFIVPGVVFGPQGERLGHGAGYYDRFLAQHPDALRIGIGFSVQMVDTPIPQAVHDIRMHEVVRP